MDRNQRAPFADSQLLETQGAHHIARTPDILSFGSEVNLLEAAKIFLNEIICGNVKPDLIVKETPEKIYTACRENIEMGKQIKSGFIFMGGCDIPATVPPYHIHLMSKAAQEFGQYN